MPTRTLRDQLTLYPSAGKHRISRYGVQPHLFCVWLGTTIVVLMMYYPRRSLRPTVFVSVQVRQELL